MRKALIIRLTPSLGTLGYFRNFLVELGTLHTGDAPGQTVIDYKGDSGYWDPEMHDLLFKFVNGELEMTTVEKRRI